MWALSAASAVVAVSVGLSRVGWYAAPSWHERAASHEVPLALTALVFFVLSLVKARLCTSIGHEFRDSWRGGLKTAAWIGTVALLPALFMRLLMGVPTAEALLILWPSGALYLVYVNTRLCHTDHRRCWKELTLLIISFNLLSGLAVVSLGLRAPVML